MRQQRNIFKVAALTAGMALAYPFAALGDQHGASGESAGKSQGDATAEARQGSSRDLENLRETTISAEELLSADVHRLRTPLGNVRNLVLNEDGSAVAYILYEVPYPYAYRGAENGFVAFDRVAVDPTTGFGEYVRIDREESAQAPERLKLDRGEADHRLVSKILDDTVSFSGGTEREVEDLLLDRETGRIKGYVVNRNPDAWFNEEPRVIPAGQVKVGQQGDVTTSAEFAALEAIE